MLMHSVAVDGVTLEYESRGSGEPVVLIHLSIYADSFAPLMDEPSLAQFQLVRYHRRGYAGSTRTTGAHNPRSSRGFNRAAGPHRRAPRPHRGSLVWWLDRAPTGDRPELVGSLVLMEPALRVRSGGPASQELSRRMALGFQRYCENDRAGAVDGFLTAVFAPGYRELLDRVIPGGWEQTVHDADMFFGIEVPELQRWQFGTSEAGRITAPALSLLGGESDPAFFEIEELLRGLLPQLETARVPNVNHLLHLKRPQVVAETMAKFLAQHPLT
jgi:pimeloyl-ACP methyl ester carboxylesterase